MFNNQPKITAVRIKKGNFVYFRTMQGKIAEQVNLDLINFSLPELEVILNELINELNIHFHVTIYRGDNHIRVFKTQSKEELLMIGDRALIVDGEPIVN
mgnify:FL=1